MTNIGSENISNGPAKAERFGGQYRGARRDSMLTEVPPDGDRGGRDVRGVAESVQSQHAPSLDPNPLTEASFPPPGWPMAENPSLVDHPLMHGLMMELPPRGSVPPPGWLDRWFEATRAILELLYVQGSGRLR
ncbi:MULTISPECIES: hypothetical protein [unclassified Micromonospora]|uniref:hypothetical protein n=1 Tax=unclassified Micromonospora TaxID=2617518 RepID=UPI0010335758|nr:MULTISPECIES: hypothetical protein [unclassified Micromonospora]QKW11379.1 hypothetical protein HUT12_00305 [Verrucosispora sp. NA02020]TBL43285.1 hypothetical protein EYA84_02665 [Verrucosispora sp. SN26_14.1]